MTSRYVPPGLSTLECGEGVGKYKDAERREGVGTWERKNRRNKP